VDLGGIEEQYYGTNIAHFLEVIAREEKAPIIIKTHNEVDFFTQLAFNNINKTQVQVLDIIKEWYDIFYIWRNLEDTMESFAKHLRANVDQNSPRSNPYPKDGKELAKMEPWGSPMFQQMKQYATFEDKWKAHHEGWIRESEKYNNIHIIRYEDLNDRFDETVQVIAKFLKKPVLKPERPRKDRNVVIGASFARA